MLARQMRDLGFSASLGILNPRLKNRHLQKSIGSLSTLNPKCDPETETSNSSLDLKTSRPNAGAFTVRIGCWGMNYYCHVMLELAATG